VKVDRVMYPLCSGTANIVPHHLGVEAKGSLYNFKDKTVTEHRPPKQTIPRMRWLTLAMLSLGLEVRIVAPTMGLKRFHSFSTRGNPPLGSRLGACSGTPNIVLHRSEVEAKGSLYTPSSSNPLRRLLKTIPWRSTDLQSGQYLRCGDSL